LANDPHLMPQYGAVSARAAPIGSTVPRTTAPTPSIPIIFFTMDPSRESPMGTGSARLP
jgi:hypothetical protein